MTKPLSDLQKSMLFPLVFAICVVGTAFVWLWSCVQNLLATPSVVVRMMKLLYGENKMKKSREGK
jgi:uncharacterized membrane protein YhaH (DUF805 family)